VLRKLVIGFVAIAEVPGKGKTGLARLLVSVLQMVSQFPLSSILPHIEIRLTVSNSAIYSATPGGSLIFPNNDTSNSERTSLTTTVT
jgi:hypothetical protein